MFKVGDKVKCVHKILDSAAVLNFVGVVIAINSPEMITVSWEGFVYGHNSCNNGRYPNCSIWHVRNDACVLLAATYGPPLPRELEIERKVIARCKKLWNESKYVQQHKEALWA